MDTFGTKLRQARLARSLSLHEVEAKIKIGSKYIEALEEENIHLLPGKAYAVGFCKKYAQFLGVDIQLSLSELKQLYSKAESEEDIIMIQEEHIHNKKRLVIGLSVFIGVVVILAGLIFYIPPKESPKALVQDKVDTKVAQTKQEAPVQSQPKAEPKPKQIPEIIATPKPQIQFAGLKLQAISDTSWVLVIVDGKETFKGMIYPGQTKTFSGKLIKIKLGNAGAIDITYNNTHIGYLGSIGQVKSKTFPDNTGVIQ